MGHGRGGRGIGGRGVDFDVMPLKMNDDDDENENEWDSQEHIRVAIDQFVYHFMLCLFLRNETSRKGVSQMAKKPQTANRKCFNKQTQRSERERRR